MVMAVSCFGWIPLYYGMSKSSILTRELLHNLYVVQELSISQICDKNGKSWKDVYNA